MTNLAYNTPYQIGQPGSPAIGGGGDMVPITYRDSLDAKRCVPAAYTPEAQNPDGYLGTITSRRDDRLLNALKDRLNQRSYTRGVHKGEQIDPQDYTWPVDFSVLSGIARQTQVIEQNGLLYTQRAAPSGTLDEMATIYGQALSSAASLTERAPNLQAAPELRRLAPSWR